MNVILLNKVENLGNIGDIVNVKPPKMNTRR
jgi:ribosomal protein L9